MRGRGCLEYWFACLSFERLARFRYAHMRRTFRRVPGDCRTPHKGTDPGHLPRVMADFVLDIAELPPDVQQTMCCRFRRALSIPCCFPVPGVTAIQWCDTRYTALAAG